MIQSGQDDSVVDVVLVGAGIMSATLGMLLHKLDPTLSIQIFERLDRTAAESSDAWNNAGTGHAAFCELNYTPQMEDGGVNIAKAIRICEQFEQSKQFWAALVERGDLPDPEQFIRPIPHISFVWGSDHAAFLKKRHATLQASPLFHGMEFTQDPAEIAAWAPLVMDHRESSSPVAATRMGIGNDVNFGAITRMLIARLETIPTINLNLNHQVEDLSQGHDGLWEIEVEDRKTGENRTIRSRFVFIGAGGGTLHLLERSGIPQARGYGGFPVNGQWLRCTNRDIIEKHNAKVYGQAELGAPPMSVPHLDTRHINGRKELLFGPYAGFTTKFLKEGSFTDLFRSLGVDNIVPMVSAGIHNIDLTRYLIGQALLPHEERVQMLRAYFPGASSDDWELEIAGLRVQIIKADGHGGGVLKFGTEIVTSTDRSLTGLLGASPGASTAVSIMLNLLEQCFPDRYNGPTWQNTLRRMFPSFGEQLHADPVRCRSSRQHTLQRLSLV